MIKGRYVAQIEVDFIYGGDKAGYKLMHDRLHSEWMDEAMTAKILEIFEGGEPVVKVTKQYADIIEVKEDE